MRASCKSVGQSCYTMARHGDGHHLLGTASSWKEAAVIATILHLFNPN